MWRIVIINMKIFGEMQLGKIQSIMAKRNTSIITNKNNKKKMMF